MMQREDSALGFKIRSMIPELSKSEALVAEYIADCPEEVINLSVSALADCCGVSEPTVVRACRNLGFSGYQALKIALCRGRSNSGGQHGNGHPEGIRSGIGCNFSHQNES